MTRLKTVHTPGPWDLISATGYAGNYEITAAVDREHEANGRLIAAAPDLLAALREAVELIHAWHGDVAWEIYNHDSPEMKRIHATIAKAEGT